MNAVESICYSLVNEHDKWRNNHGSLQHKDNSTVLCWRFSEGWDSRVTVDEDLSYSWPREEYRKLKKSIKVWLNTNKENEKQRKEDKLKELFHVDGSDLPMPATSEITTADLPMVTIDKGVE